MKTLFFELIQVAIGRRDALSRVPSAKEWCELYGLSVKQALTGVCFLWRATAGEGSGRASAKAADDAVVRSG